MEKMNVVVNNHIKQVEKITNNIVELSDNKPALIIDSCFFCITMTTEILKQRKNIRAEKLLAYIQLHVCELCSELDFKSQLKEQPPQGVEVQ